MAVIPTLLDYEYQFGDTGTLLNPTAAGHAASLPFVDIAKVGGLDTPEYRSAQRDHEGVDGGFIDSEFMKSRTITLEGTIYADPDDPETIADSLKFDFRPSKTTIPFYFKHPGKATRVVYGKGQSVRYDVDALRRTGKSNVAMLIVCPDPYIYDAVPAAASGMIVSAGSGFGFNMAFDLSFGGAVTTGGVTISNVGNHRAYPVITIFGPIKTPVLTESTTGRVLTFNLTLNKNDWLVIDTRRHTAMLNGVASMRSLLAPGSLWFWTDPFSTHGSSTITFTGDMSTITGVATGTATSLTTNYLRVTDADASDIAIGDKCWLENSSGVLKEPFVVTVTAMTSAAGNTDIYFSPSASAVTVSGDRVRAGIPTFDVRVYPTWY